MNNMAEIIKKRASPSEARSVPVYIRLLSRLLPVVCCAGQVNVDVRAVIRDGVSGKHPQNEVSDGEDGDYRNDRDHRAHAT